MGPAVVFFVLRLVRAARHRLEAPCYELEAANHNAADRREV